MAGTVLAMEKPVQWMTLQELRDELERTRPAWETTELDGVLADGQFPALADESCSSSGFSQLCRHIPGCPRRYYNLDPIPQWKKY